MNTVKVALQAARLGEPPAANGAFVSAHIKVLPYVHDDACALPALVVAVANVALVELVDFLAAESGDEALREGVRGKRAQTAVDE